MTRKFCALPRWNTRTLEINPAQDLSLNELTLSGINMPSGLAEPMDFPTISPTQFAHPSLLGSKATPAHGAWPSRIQCDLALLKFYASKPTLQLAPEKYVPSQRARKMKAAQQECRRIEFLCRESWGKEKTFWEVPNFCFDLAIRSRGRLTAFSFAF